jgi:integrase
MGARMPNGQDRQSAETKPLQFILSVSAMLLRPTSVAVSDVSTSAVQISWSERYGSAHELRRVVEFPLGMRPPKRLRIYARGEHFIVQWWDPQEKKNLNERVNGDLVDAIARGREIEARLENLGRSGHGNPKVGHEVLLDRYLDDLRRRADAGQLAVSTVERYEAALEHYRAFVCQPSQRKAFPYPAGANRDFQLAVAAHLEQLAVTRDGHPHARRRPLRSPQLVLDAVRAMFAWAADPARGNLLPVEFRNPFQQPDRSRRSQVIDPFGQPDITTAMTIDLLGACDAFQLPLFAALALFGLRASEPIFIFREQIEEDWFRVTCHPQLGFLTKGKRDKRFPMPPSLRQVLLPAGSRRDGLLFTRREAGLGPRNAPLCGGSLADLSAEFQRRCRLHATSSAATRQSIRDELIRAAGGLNYDQIQHEFRGLANQLGWPRQATLKDIRHHFATVMENSGVASCYARYLMGHTLGKTPIVTYTHLNQLQSQFQKALDQDLAPIVDAVERRARELDQAHSAITSSRRNSSRPD